MAARLNAEASLNGGVSASASVGVKTISASATLFKAQSIVPYSGDYEITPTNEEQTIPIYGKTATQNIVVKAIPSNYGEIVWNGSSILVR